MLVTRTCLFTGHTNTLDLPISEVQLAAYEAGVNVQHAFPQLDDDQREFILNGILPGTFEEHVGTEEDYEYDDDDETAFGYDDDEDIYDFETDAPF
jgi:hypothetical protein